jgi:L-lactate dehydrogenase complex protein LldG
MSSRDSVLAALRRSAPPPSPLPDAPAGTSYPDAERQFSETLASVGGKVIVAASVAEADTELRGLEVYTQSQRIASLVPGVGESNVDLSAMKDPHELEGIDLAIIPGEIGVAENAAVWVPGGALGPHRAIFVAAQHLILVVPRDAIVDNMQQAYERIQLERPGFGVFISGPSKTADIEQSLVIGAHGPRSCTVLLIRPA